MPRIPLNMLLLSALLALPAVAQAQESDVTAAAEASAPVLEILPAEAVDLDSYLWTKRVLIVFSDTPADPRFVKQMQELEARPRDMIERDVVVVTDTAPAAQSEIRKRLRPRGFALVLLDKDGVVKLRKPAPWSAREISRSIDKTPLRQQEIRDRSGSIGQ